MIELPPIIADEDVKADGYHGDYIVRWRLNMIIKYLMEDKKSESKKCLKQ